MNIALLTDFGTKDYYVGAMKGVILSINENVGIVDISHEIPPQDISSASFNLKACYKNFPHKTIFVAVVDPGVGSSRRAILVETDEYYFIAPDNGLLSFVFREEKGVKVFEITNEEYLSKNICKTFHGRDIFAPIAAHLSKGVNPKQFGNEIKEYKQFSIGKPHKKEDGIIKAKIAHIDHFGNLILNIYKKDLPKSFTLDIGDYRVTKLRQYFTEDSENRLDNSKDKIFMLFGSLDLLEIVVFEDSAEKILNVGVGEKVYINV